MYRIIGSRVTGKTCSLMMKTEFLLSKNNERQVYYIAKEPEIMKWKYENEGFKYGDRVHFISFEEAKDIDKNEYKIIDELDDFFKTINVFGYSISTSDDDYSFLEE